MSFDILIGVIVSVLSYFVIETILPSKYREKTHFIKKSIFKWIHNESMDLNLVVKTNLNEPYLELNEFKNMFKDELLKRKFTPNDNDYSFSVGIPVGERTIQSKIHFMTDVIDDVEVVDTLQFSFNDKSHFRNFKLYAYELNIAKDNLEKILKNIIPEFSQEMSFTCKLKALPEINGILHSTNFNTLDCTTPDGKNFEITENQITWYDIEINTYMLDFLKTMIISYS